MFSLIPDDSDDYLDQAMRIPVKQVKREADLISHNEHEYQGRMNIDLAEEYTRETTVNILCPNTTPKMSINKISNNDMITTQLTKVPCYYK